MRSEELSFADLAKSVAVWSPLPVPPVPPARPNKRFDTVSPADYRHDINLIVFDFLDKMRTIGEIAVFSDREGVKELF